jgi:hypothetical protein
MKKYLLLSLLVFCFTIILKSQSVIWNDIQESQVEQIGDRLIIPTSYRVLEFEINNLKNLLESAPEEFTIEASQNPSIVSLPMPDGTFQRFNFWESPTMEAELQAQYPEIRTYTGQGIDDPYATIKFDLTPHGFHAQILSPDGRVFIDPHNKGDIHHYISYYTKDFVKRDGFFECQVEYDEDYDFHFSPESILTPSGPQLRTYRLANAATLEYTNFHGGTVALGLAAVVTSVNRVNGVYERESAVRMVLVANNNLIIYTTASGDPYSNTNGSLMLSQNISNLSTVIGNANFDIGHVFSTGGGGVAYLGCVCTSNKAGGVTGSSSPVGDPFDIDYVAHEMGHQFGGNHSFNGTTGSCSGSNRNASTAYEPGSGSTIMAYAGICSPQDLQSNSDAYFHSVNFDEIIAFTNSGSGNTCAVITSTGNNAPIVTVPSGGFAIPKSTPFSLTGSATDPNSDAMTYCWEEYDLGPAGAPGTPSGDAPIFRSWNPTTSPTRTFPRLTDLLNNTSVIGELLPSYARNLKFRLTVRDNRAGGGGVDRAQVNFTVDGNSGPFVVTSPNTNVSWTGNTTQTITWSVANTTASPVNCANVRILLSTNGGNTFSTELIASTPNDGSELVTIPNLPSTQARIKVEAVGNIFFDISNVNFAIINNPGAINPVSFSSTAVGSSQINLAFTPNGSNNNVVIVWNNTGTFTTPSGTPPSVGSAFAGGTLIYNGTSSPQIHAGLTAVTNYFYKAFSYNGSTYSSGLTSSASTFSIDNPTTFEAIPVSSTEIYVAFTPNIVTNNVVIVWNTSESFTIPVGTPPVVGQPFAGGTLLYNGLTSPQLHNELNPATDYYYNAFSYDGLNYSFGLNAEATTLTIPSTFQLSVAISDGWNMVSAPGLHPINQDVTTWWSGKDPSAGVFRFNGGYVPVTTTIPGQGYWMKHTGANIYNTGDEYPVGGIQIVTHDPIAGTTGWNLIGGYETSVATSGITTTPPGLQSGQVFQYGSGYTVATSLVPGYGYWIKLTAPGSINIPTSLAKGLAKNEVNTSDWGKIIITDKSGKSYTLYTVKGKVNLNDFELPPAPPTGMFDVRFGTGRYAEELSAVNQSIELNSLEYPVTVRVENADIRLQDGTGNGLNERLKSSEEITISNSAISKLLVSQNIIPDEYALEQNYPNPFNPSTIISWQSPVDSRQIIKIYDALGNEVATLVDEFKPAGRYDVEFNALSISSGVYFYTLQAGSFRNTKKMLILK